MKNDKDLTEELGHSMPSSKRETEEDMLEELCSLAKDARITIPEICGRMEMPPAGSAGLSEAAFRKGLCKNRRKKKLPTFVSQNWDASAEKNAATVMKPSPSFWSM